MSKLLGLYLKLNGLGHPQYLAESSLPPISCSGSEEKVRITVLEMQDAVEKWQKEVSELRSHYTWLLYFSVPKMLLLHRQINSSPQDINAIVHEVSFVVYNQKIKRTELQHGVEVSFKIHHNFLLTCTFLYT